MMLQSKSTQLEPSSGSSDSLYSSSGDEASIGSHRNLLLQDVFSNLKIESPRKSLGTTHKVLMLRGECATMESLFAEPDRPENILYDTAEGSGGQIIAATVTKLVEKLTTTLDSVFMEDFFLSYRGFLESRELSKLLAFRLLQGFRNASQEGQSLRLRTFVVLRLWLRGFYDVDFEGEAVKKPLLDMIDQIWELGIPLTLSDKQMLIKLRRYLLHEETIREEPSSTPPPPKETDPPSTTGDVKRLSWTKKLSGRIIRLVSGRTSGSDDYESSIHARSIDTSVSTESTSSDLYFTPPWLLEESAKKYEKHSVLAVESSENLAQHFCLIESKLFQLVSWHELLNYCGASIGMTEGTLQAFINHFNQMCQWIINEVTRCSSHHEQSVIIRKLIRVALKCLGYSNFNSVMQIMLALQNPAIESNHPAWEKLCDYEKSLFDDLVVFASPLRNFKNVRKAMELLEHRTTPCIPFTGLYLSDLINNNERPGARNNLVPWFKYQLAARIIRQFRAFQSVDRLYSFQVRPDLYRHLLQCCEQSQE